MSASTASNGEVHNRNSGRCLVADGMATGADGRVFQGGGNGSLDQAGHYRL
ncbi:hypothetical protein [Streptomyces melanogenes]|uniref:hypothetical protein n=1 Tax=Streptomyces melanogenes TaxID=67326 RepID=UPI0037AFB098